MKTMKGPATAPMSHPVVEPVTPAAIDGTTTRQRAMTAILWDPRRSVSIPSLSICDKYCSLCCTTRFHCSFITLIIFFVCYSPPPSIIISHYWLHNWWMNLTSVRYADYVSAVGFQSEYWGGGVTATSLRLPPLAPQSLRLNPGLIIACVANPLIRIITTPWLYSHEETTLKLQNVARSQPARSQQTNSSQTDWMNHFITYLPFLKGNLYFICCFFLFVWNIYILILLLHVRVKWQSFQTSASLNWLTDEMNHSGNMKMN